MSKSILITLTGGNNHGASHDTPGSNRVRKMTDKGLADKERDVTVELSSFPTTKRKKLQGVRKPDKIETENRNRIKRRRGTH